MASVFRIDDAQIGFRNFAGKESQYNPEGNRNFCVFIDDSEFAHELMNDGWNVRWTKPRNEDDEPRAYMPVKVAFNNYPPNIFMLSNGVKEKLNENNVEVLDWSDIESCDMEIRPYHWNKGGRSGVSAYLKTLYVKIADDALDAKYANYGVADE